MRSRSTTPDPLSPNCPTSPPSSSSIKAPSDHHHHHRTTSRPDYISVGGAPPYNHHLYYTTCQNNTTEQHLHHPHHRYGASPQHGSSQPQQYTVWQDPAGATVVNADVMSPPSPAQFCSQAGHHMQQPQMPPQQQQQQYRSHPSSPTQNYHYYYYAQQQQQQLACNAHLGAPQPHTANQIAPQPSQPPPPSGTGSRRNSGPVYVSVSSPQVRRKMYGPHGNSITTAASTAGYASSPLMTPPTANTPASKRPVTLLRSLDSSTNSSVEHQQMQQLTTSVSGDIAACYDSTANYEISV